MATQEDDLKIPRQSQVDARSGLSMEGMRADPECRLMATRHISNGEEKAGKARRPRSDPGPSWPFRATSANMRFSSC